MVILKVWKDYGITSTEFAKKLKLENNFNKICFAGRLDPLAQGEMIFLTDQDTKFVSEYLGHNKTYKFSLILGIDTVSHDCFSKIEGLTDVKSLDKNSLDTFIKNYKSQEYPLVSSYTIEHNGVKNPLWWFYANGYTKDQLNIPSKAVSILNYKVYNITVASTRILSEQFINKIKLIENTNLKTQEYINQWENINVNYNHTIIEMEMNVNSGFYIRKFCDDFGKYTGIGGIAYDITRIGFN
jgi:tRNA U55 pseudouridine synthase TruB